MNLKVVGYQTVKELWNLFELDDGSKLKVKIVLITALDENGSSDETSGLSLQTETLVGIIPNESLIKEGNINQIDDIGFTVIDEDWNEYRLDNGLKLYMKPGLAQVTRTGEKDPKGMPVYGVQSNPLIKIKT